MSPLIETIKCLDGKLFNLKEHNKRLNCARQDLYGLSKEIDLNQQIEIPDDVKLGLFRCRIIYQDKIDKIEFIPHQFREIKTLKIIEDNDIDYRYKYNNRESLNKLFEQRGNDDDIVIVKNGFITDSYIANLVFFDGKKWCTPDTPLLRGTQRERLLKEGKIVERKITISDILIFTKVGLINAMWDLNNMPQISVMKIRS